MRPEDILYAIGELDEQYIRKAHRKSLLKAFIVFLVIFALGVTIIYSQLQDCYLQLRYNPDGSVITEFIDPEAILQNKWTSMDYTAYENTIPVSTTRFQRKFSPDYRIVHTENGAETVIVGSGGENDYLGSTHYTNLYIHTGYSTDLLERIDGIYINSETAYGTLNKQLNCIKLDYYEHSERVHRQYLMANGHTTEEYLLRSRGYSYTNGQLSGWMEWDAEDNLLTYAEYRYDGSTQTVSTFLADGTSAETRVSRYAFGKLRWREYYDSQGVLTGREIYHYRIWEPFLCLPGLIGLVILISIAATFAFAVWDSRIHFGDRLIPQRIPATREDTLLLIQKTEELKTRTGKLSARLNETDTEALREEITALQVAIEELNTRLSQLLDSTPKKP